MRRRLITVLEFISIPLFITSTAVGADDLHTPGGAGGRPPAELDAQVQHLMLGKCYTCHDDGDPKLLDKQKVLKAIDHEPGVKPMPPSTQPQKGQLTTEEKELITKWAGGNEPAGKAAADSCSKADSVVSKNVIKEILADRCVVCHGKLSSNPSSPIRLGHTQFLDNDGGLDLFVLGDMSDVSNAHLPQDKTSLGRILEELTAYTMPPRKNLPVVGRPSERFLPEVGTPHMTEPERNAVITFLKDQLRHESCPPQDLTTIVSTADGKHLKQTYKDAAASCAAAGQHIPTQKQLVAMKVLVGNEFGNQGCVWSSSFHEADRDDKRIWRQMIYWDEKGAAQEGSATEDYSCQTACVR